MIKPGFYIALLMLMLLRIQTAKAQFVTINLEIPAGTTLESQVVDPMKGGSWEKSKAIYWIEINTPENLALLLDIHYPTRAVEPPLESYFLNNGTSNFEESYLLREGERTVVINQSGPIIRNMNPRPLTLSAWLGIPMTSGISIKI
ncbi:MAG: hypothetical protein ABJH01_11225, partial [Algoriphagus sp.]